MKKTYQPKEKEVTKEWHLIDAKGKILGRMATEIAGLLMGKGKVNYAPHMDMGDYVVVTNASGVEVTGKKKDQKVYQSHSGFPGGFKEVNFRKLHSEQPAKVIELAVSRMLPKNRLQKKRMARLKVFASDEHIYSDKFLSSAKGIEQSAKDKNKES